MCLLNMQPENSSTNKKNRKILKRVCSGVCVSGGGGGDAFGKYLSLISFNNNSVCFR